MVPQRSRRLSASGMQRQLHHSTVVNRLKEADAFQRLVSPVWIFFSHGRTASKKQTPFSVWYMSYQTSDLLVGDGLKEADAFQRLVLRACARGWGRGVPLKEADAFQRLVCAYPARTPTLPALPQRSRRLSASGMR